MKQQFTAKHPWTILAAGAAIQVLTGIPAAWGVFQQPVMDEYGLSEQGAGYAFGILIAAFGVGCVLRTAEARGVRLCGEQHCCAADFLQRLSCRAAVRAAFFWHSVSRRGWARRFCTHPSNPAHRSGMPGARALPPA